MAADVFRMIAELRLDVDHLNRAIASLEELQRGEGKTRDPRGRRFMGAEERQEVSDRMKKYWATRRRKPLSGPRTAGADLTKVRIPTGQRID